MWLKMATSMGGSWYGSSEAGVSRGTTRIAPPRLGSVRTVRFPMRSSAVAWPTQTAETGALRSSRGIPRTAGCSWATRHPQKRRAKRDKAALRIAKMKPCREGPGQALWAQVGKRDGRAPQETGDEIGKASQAQGREARAHFLRARSIAPRGRRAARGEGAFRAD